MLQQTVLATASGSELLTILVKFLELFAIPVILYIVNRLNQIDKTLQENAKELVSFKTLLIGVDGQNGFRSRIVKTEEQIEDLQERIRGKNGQ